MNNVLRSFFILFPEDDCDFSIAIFGSRLSDSLSSSLDVAEGSRLMLLAVDAAVLSSIETEYGRVTSLVLGIGSFMLLPIDLTL
mmetsp:Transcript_2217/g.3506  ORF Transcript_2217/g.3506 Transcript_2217/m.3506 type:complete len:84 (-) Transcript_2217:1253-1504(-)